MKKPAYTLTVVGAILTIAASFLAIAVSIKSLMEAKRAQEGLGDLAQYTMPLAYRTEIIAPKGIYFSNDRHIKMEVGFGRDITRDDNVWVIGFDQNNKYPLKQIEMPIGQGTWSSNIELPHMSSWVLYVYRIDSEYASILKKRHEKKIDIDKVPGDAFYYMNSVEVVYGDSNT